MLLSYVLQMYSDITKIEYIYKRNYIYDKTRYNITIKRTQLSIVWPRIGTTLFQLVMP